MQRYKPIDDSDEDNIDTAVDSTSSSSFSCATTNMFAKPREKQKECLKCCICLETGVANRMCLPCGHLAMCSDCFGTYGKKEECPLCKTAVEHVVDVFF